VENLQDVSDSPAPDSLDGLRREVEELRASRRRLVLESDAENRALERALHDGLQQRLVALAVELQHVAAVAERDGAAAKELLDKMSDELQTAIDEAGRLAERIHTPLLEEKGRLALTLRAAAVAADVRADVEVAADSGYPPEVARTVVLGWLQALEATDTTTPSVKVHEEDGALVFEIVSGTALERLGERVAALGGRFEAHPTDGDAMRVIGALPLPPSD
jgi:Histidine kinase